MVLLKFAAAGLLAAAASPSFAGVTVIGTSTARLCYEAAESTRSVSAAMLANCNEALADVALTQRDLVATYVNRGILRLRMNQTDAAIADFDTAIAKDPGEAEAYLNKGMALLRSSEGGGQALTLFDTALAKRTRKPAIAYYGRAIAHEMTGNVRKAYFDYRQASQLAPEWTLPKDELVRFKVQTR